MPARLRPAVDLVPLEAVGGPDRAGDLARLYDRIFAPGAGRTGAWFLERAHRTCLDWRASAVAVAGPPNDPSAWCGLGLVGRPPSLAPVARAAGMGVVPERRGCGLGPRLVAAMLAGARRGGACALEVTAHPTLVPFYEALGFSRGAAVETWRAPARPRDRRWAPRPTDWDDPALPRVPCGEHREAWDRGRRPRTLGWGRGTRALAAFVADVPAGLRVVRLAAGEDTPDADLAAALAGLGAPAPVFVTGVPPDAPIRAILVQAGFRLVERGIRLRRPTVPPGPVPAGERPLDKPRSDPR